MKSYAHLADRLFNQPLVLTQAKADTFADVFNAHLTNTQAELPKFDAPARIDILAQGSMRRADGGYYVTNQGVAIVEVHGSMVQRSAGMLDALSGLSGYNTIGSAVLAAVRDPGVRGVIIEFDSPGGEVAGVMDLANTIAGVDKPVWAHANEVATSGAYWLAASADRIYSAPTAIIGSIGVLMMHADKSKIVERSGVVYTPIFAGARKVDGSSLYPLSEEARSRSQAMVDSVYAKFVDHVAQRRDLDAQVVRDTEAGIYTADEAVDIGLVDGVALLGDTIQMMTDALYSEPRLERKRYRRAAASAQHFTGAGDMSNVDKPAAAPAQQPAATFTQADVDRARAEGVTQGSTEATDRVAKEAKEATAKAEADAKTRIKAITESDEGKQRPALANRLAFDTDMGAEAAVALMKGVPKELAAGAVNTLGARMAAEAPNAVIGAATTDSGEESDEAAGKRMAGYANGARLSAVK